VRCQRGRVKAASSGQASGPSLRAPAPLEGPSEWSATAGYPSAARGCGEDSAVPIWDGRREIASRLRRSEAPERRGSGSLRRGEGDTGEGAVQGSLRRSGRRTSGDPPASGAAARRPPSWVGCCQGSRQSSSPSSSSSQSNRSSTQRPSRAGFRPPAPRPRRPSPAASAPGRRDPGLAPATPSTSSRPRLTQRSRR